MNKLIFLDTFLKLRGIIPVISLLRSGIRAKWYIPEKICKTYVHIYPDGREIPGVRQYPDFLYPLFTEWFQKEWLAKRCAQYIIKRTDEYALPYLQNTFPSVIEYEGGGEIEGS